LLPPHFYRLPVLLHLRRTQFLPGGACRVTSAVSALHLHVSAQLPRSATTACLCRLPLDSVLHMPCVSAAALLPCFVLPAVLDYLRCRLLVPLCLHAAYRLQFALLPGYLAFAVSYSLIRAAFSAVFCRFYLPAPFLEHLLLPFPRLPACLTASGALPLAGLPLGYVLPFSLNVTSTACLPFGLPAWTPAAHLPPFCFCSAVCFHLVSFLRSACRSSAWVLLVPLARARVCKHFTLAGFASFGLTLNAPAALRAPLRETARACSGQQVLPRASTCHYWILRCGLLPARCLAAPLASPCRAPRTRLPRITALPKRASARIATRVN